MRRACAHAEGVHALDFGGSGMHTFARAHLVRKRLAITGLESAVKQSINLNAVAVYKQ